MYTIVLHLLVQVLDGGCWVTVGCHNSVSWYKKG